MASIKEFEDIMYKLDASDIMKNIDNAKSYDDAKFWVDVLNRILQHNQKKTIKEKFTI